ncbi:mannosyltransferase family protein [Leifsonia shinshuensis]|uniref:DUF2029 domain-containing protein n=1 Tax=Leifsonia shinshuensis TaxID=150026 RepID=A0A853CZY4_9MICO|nr:mannosyltransferase family protein [Leifsonia shinshuensis]NYJ25739.1 hypothetical protein [Leifsonia shinshuensis]
MTTTEPATTTVVAPSVVTADDTRKRRLIRGVLVAASIWAVTHIGAQLAAALAVAIHTPQLLAQPWSFFTLLVHWDAANYRNVAQFGYFSEGAGPFAHAFLPGYPFVSRFLAEALFVTVSPTAVQIDVALWTVTAVAALVAACLLWFLVEPQYGRRVAFGSVALLLAGPYALFLVAPYPEALYLVPAIGAWLAMRNERWVIAGLLACFAGTIRIETVFLVPALIVLFAVQRHREGLPWLTRAIGFGAISAVGLTSYLLWLWHRTGNIRAWFDVEEAGWHRSTRWPWETFARSLEYATSPATVRAGHIQAWADIVFVVLYLIAIVMFIRLRWWAEAVYIGLSTVSMATSYAYTSMARESTTLFPLTILVALTLRTRRWRWVFWVVLVLSALIMFAQAGRFALDDWSD